MSHGHSHGTPHERPVGRSMGIAMENPMGRPKGRPMGRRMGRAKGCPMRRPMGISLGPQAIFHGYAGSLCNLAKHMNGYWCRNPAGTQSKYDYHYFVVHYVTLNVSVACRQ